MLACHVSRFILHEASMTTHELEQLLLQQPVSLQVVGAMDGDARLLALSRWLEPLLQPA